MGDKQGTVEGNTVDRTVEDEGGKFDVELEAGQQLGLTFGPNMEVKEIDPKSPLAKKILVGDTIQEVNDEKVKDEDGLKAAVEKFRPSLAIKFNRGLKSTAAEKIPSIREKNLNRQAGFTYHIAKIDYVKGCKFGMGIKHFQNKVLVSRVDEGSLSAKCLVGGDRIVDVNGTPVTDKDVARTMLLKALQKDKTVSLLIERAISEDAKEKIMFAMNQSEMQPPSVAMASDILGIINRQKTKMAAKGPVKKSVLRKTNESKQAKGKVTMAEQNQNVHLIRSDNEGKQLKPVPPAQPPPPPKEPPKQEAPAPPPPAPEPKKEEAPPPPAPAPKEEEKPKEESKKEEPPAPSAPAAEPPKEAPAAKKDPSVIGAAPKKKDASTLFQPTADAGKKTPGSPNKAPTKRKTAPSKKK